MAAMGLRYPWVAGRLGGSSRVAQLNARGEVKAQEARLVSCGATKRPPCSLLLGRVRLVHRAHRGKRLSRGSG